MTEVDENLTLKVSELARLELTPQELQAFTSQIREILAYVEQIRGVRVEGVDPMTHPLALATPLREDEALSSPVDENGKPKVLKHAPDVLYDGFKVPPIL